MCGAGVRWVRAHGFVGCGATPVRSVVYAVYFIVCESSRDASFVILSNHSLNDLSSGLTPVPWRLRPTPVDRCVGLRRDVNLFVLTINASSHHFTSFLQQ